MYHFEGKRSVISWEMIVHYPRYKLRGQIRLKDTTSFRWARICFLLSAFCFLSVCLHYRFVSFIILFLVFEPKFEQQSPCGL